MTISDLYLLCNIHDPFFIGHLKSDYRLSRNSLKGEIGDHINLLMAATAWNLKKWLNHFFVFVFYGIMRPSSRLIARLCRQNETLSGLKPYESTKIRVTWPF